MTMTQQEIDKIIATREENVEIAKRLKAVEHLSYPAIAKRMGVNENAVRLMLSKKR